MREQAPYEYLPELAGEVRPALQRFVETLLEWGRTRYE
jgi:hypothetical protein